MKKSNSGCDLRTCFICQLSLNEWKPAIEGHRKNYTVKKGELILREGEPVTGIYFVYKGSVKVHKKWGDRELIVRFATEGKIIGHRGLGTKNSVYPISATALETTTVCFVELDFFLATLKVNHDLAYKLLMFFADELQESERRMRDLALSPVKSRLAGALLQLSNIFGVDETGHINVELSRQDLASFTGATYETVFRTMNELLQENLISLAGKKICITDQERLNALTLESLS